jgi:murein DD-endopeptidase MepM/ murein hydrolase activator NlpD
MKVIFISRKHGGSRSIELSRWSRALLSLCCLGLPLGLAASGYIAGQESGARALRGEALDASQDDLQQQSADVSGQDGSTEHQVQALTINLAELEARMTRLDALGQHLTVMAKLEDGEFDFSQPPAVGGPQVSEATTSFTPKRLDDELDQFEARLDDRERQLDILESMLTSRKLEEQGSLSGLPVKMGYMSSHYGWRKDPINGKTSLHNGLDFAGKSGSDVVAVASGVVTWSGRDAGYGNIVEISHGDDYVTRYAHNKETLVHPGDVVRKGETIALMGSTGRSTGSHVHFEVYKNGRSVDPSSYVARTHP